MIQEKIPTIPLSEVEEYRLLIRALLNKGKSYIREYIYLPLYRYFPEEPSYLEPKEIIRRIEFYLKTGEYKKVSSLYKKLILEYLHEKNYRKLLQAIGNFLRDLKESEKLRRTPFAQEFFQALREPLKNFRRLYGEETIKNFHENLEKLSEEEISSISSFTPAKKPSLPPSVRRKLDQEAEELYKKIERAFVRKDEKTLSYLLAQFTGRFANYPDVPHREEVDKIIESLLKEDPTFYKEVKNRLAIKLFREIADSIRKGNLRKAVRGIATFVLTFQGDTDVPFRKELDEIEEKLYRFIEERNLWQRLRVR